MNKFDADVLKPGFDFSKLPSDRMREVFMQMLACMDEDQLRKTLDIAKKEFGDHCKKK